MMEANRTTVTWKLAALLALTLLLAATLTVPNAYAASGCYGSGSNGTVALDPGHGGSDPGTSNATYGLVEKEVVLDIAFRTKDILTSKGYRVCLTRIDNSSNPSNTQRAQYANSVGAKVFVLIHLNGSTDKSVNYTSTFWGKKIKDQELAKHMYNRLKSSLGLPGGYVGQFASGALLKSKMPATLTESVFLANDEEAARLADSSGSRRQQIAQALADGIDTWLK